MGVLLESLNVIIAYIAAYGKPGSEVEVLTDAIKQCSGEVFVEPHVVGSDAQNAVCAFVSEPDGSVKLGCVAYESEEVDARFGVYVHQA